MQGSISGDKALAVSPRCRAQGVLSAAGTFIAGMVFGSLISLVHASGRPLSAVVKSTSCKLARLRDRDSLLSGREDTD